MMLLVFAAGILVGMWLPALLGWVMTLGELDHVSVRRRRLRLDEILEAELGNPLVIPAPRRPGRHEHVVNEDA
jgi:hypothetical protein